MLELVVFIGLGIAMLMVAAAWIAVPLRRGVVLPVTDDRRALRLLAQREAVLAAIRDLDADHDDGRLSDREHEQLKAEALAQGSAVLAALDRLASERGEGAATLVHEIEAQVAVRLAETTQPSESYECPRCGHLLGPDDRFCAGCGAAREEAAG